MVFLRSEIKDIIICQPTIHQDDRGYFMESFRQDKLNDFLGYNINFCQDNESESSFGVLRGLHYQLPPKAQTKLLRVIEGSILDIVVDIRQGSPTFGKHLSVELSSENKKQLLVPRGFAHGFVVLSEKVILSYKVDNYYSAECDRGLSFKDDSLAIDWQIDMNCLKISPKDLNQPNLAQVKESFDYQQNYYVN